MRNDKRIGRASYEHTRGEEISVSIYFFHSFSFHALVIYAYTHTHKKNSKIKPYIW